MDFNDRADVFKRELGMPEIAVTICSRTDMVLLMDPWRVLYRIDIHMWEELWEQDPSSWKAYGVSEKGAMLLNLLMMADGKLDDRIPPIEKEQLNDTGKLVIEIIKYELGL